MSIEEICQGFAALGSEPRVEVLLCIVRTGEAGMSFGEIQLATEMPSSTLHHHLNFLLAAGLIEQEKIGRQTVSRPSFSRLEHLSSFILSQCCAATSNPLDRTERCTKKDSSDDRDCTTP